jgi:uncharacterized protein (TIGR00255 family)
MTGFGRSRRESAEQVFEVEVRAVNNRFLKVQPRLSESLAPLSAHIEQRVRERLARGTVHVTIRHVRKSGAGRYRIDEDVLRRYAETLERVRLELRHPQPFTMAEVAALPGVVHDAEEAQNDLESFWDALRPALDAALDGLIAMRHEEGAGIARDLVQVCEKLLGLAVKVEGRIDPALDEYRKKLRARIEKLLQGSGIEAPEPDLARELAMFADRSDISEELQRLRSHCSQVKETLRAPAEPVGRKLEFLAQELLREANTMASKSHDTSLVSHVLEMKLEVEKVREQVANLE